MSDLEEKKELYNKIKKLLDGEIKSERYTDNEIIEKINHFKNLHPVKSIEMERISKKRWETEIARNTELNDRFKECPDLAFTRLEYISKFGL